MGAWTRRQFLATAGAAIATAGVGTGLYTWQIEPHWLEVVQRILPVPGLPASLEGATLAQLSDIHVGERVSDAYLLDTFARVAALAPDIVTYTGDFTSYHPGVFEQATRVYAQAPHGRLATVGILGNHDYGPGWQHADVADRLTGILSAHGITILRNAIVDVQGLQVIGLDDLWAKRTEIAPTLARLQPGAAVALSHNPDTVDLPGWDRFQGWVLSGHTHGGQCRPPFLPPPLLPVRNRRYTAGAFPLDGRRTLYVNRGVGHLTKVRFNVRPEVTLFELRRPGLAQGGRPGLAQQARHDRARQQHGRTAAHSTGVLPARVL